MKRLQFKALPPLLAIVLISTLSCKRELLPPEPVIHNPVWLDYDSTQIWLADYMPPGMIPDSITVMGQRFQYNAKTGYFYFKADNSAPAMFIMSFWKEAKPIDVVLRKSPKIKISFTFNPSGKTYQSVALKGEFNGWTPSKTPLLFEDGAWKTDLILSSGKYQYLIVADGQEMLDPACTVKVDNNMGGFNSLMDAGEIDISTLPVLLTESYKGHSITIRTINKPDNFIAFWNNKSYAPDGLAITDSTLILNIPREASKYERSWIRVFSWNSSGASNDLLIPLEKGSVITDPAMLKRTDLQASILYNVFVDRFFNGDASNDKHLPDSIVLPKANYYGGDIAGVIQKLDEGYFRDLGVNTLWLSPVVKNVDGPYGFWPEPKTKFSAYHGYWPTSFTDIDSHFGKASELKNLVEKAHQDKVNILLDFVAHHVHQDHPYYKANPTKVTNLYLPDGTLNTERWDEHRLTTWFDVFLPTLDLAQSDVAELVSDSTVWWITEYGIDGFRHDAAKHVPLEFWRTLTSKIKRDVVYPLKKPVFQMGETYGGVELIGSYLGSGLLDAQFDFNVFDAALGAFAGGQTFDVLEQRLRESNKYYGSHNLMGYITGNQDRGRSISYAGGDLKFDENAKMAGWTREIGVGDPIAYPRMRMLMAFNMTIPGVPVIYYGDEFGMPGGNDPDSRRMMRFGNELNQNEQQNLKATQKLTAIRRSNMALMYGDFCMMQNNGNTLAYARTYFGNTVIVAFNNSATSTDITIDTSRFAKGKTFTPNFGNKAKQTGNVITLTLAPYSFELMTPTK